MDLHDRPQPSDRPPPRRPPQDAARYTIEGESLEPAVSDPWAAVALELSGEEVRKALAELPPEQRQTIELAYYGGYSQSEIATAMEVPLAPSRGGSGSRSTSFRASLADRVETPWQTQ